MRKSFAAAMSAGLLLAGMVSQAAEAAAATPEPKAFAMAQADGRPELAGMSLAQARELQAEIDQQMKDVPGGIQVSANEIAWKGGSVVMSFPVPSQRTAPETSGKLLGGAALKGADAVSPRATGTCYDTGSCSYQKCPYGFRDMWYCLYADRDYGGRRLQWKDVYEYTNALDQWNFNYQASSWVNTSTKMTVEVYGPGDQRLWVMPSRANFFSDPTHNNYVGNDVNDRATSFTAVGG
ncbi:peptidase inhibitor family I36 protein [Kitasatospora sp. NPDC051914]|uniref:peptidase inhibitor family I36 protein n=1 Tax=Kitasatospora sp. NPDC051914 TaxID=3154945 RepID=UPI0034469699